MRDPAVRQRARLWKKAAIGLAVVAVVGGLVAAALALSWRENRARPMYHDVISMAGLQYDLLESGQEGLELSIDAESGPVLVGDEPFTALPGVQILVEERGESYCVKGRNQYGDETGWTCVDGTGDRPDLGALEHEF